MLVDARDGRSMGCGHTLNARRRNAQLQDVCCACVCPCVCVTHASGCATVSVVLLPVDTVSLILSLFTPECAALEAGTVCRIRLRAFRIANSFDRTCTRRNKECHSPLVFPLEFVSDAWRRGSLSRLHTQKRKLAQLAAKSRVKLYPRHDGCGGLRASLARSRHPRAALQAVIILFLFPLSCECIARPDSTVLFCGSTLLPLRATTVSRRQTFTSVLLVL